MWRKEEEFNLAAIAPFTLWPLPSETGERREREREREHDQEEEEE